MKMLCPQCGQHIAADDDWIGMTVTCPNCGQDLQLALTPSQVDEATANPAAPAPPPPPAEPSATADAPHLTLQRKPPGEPPPIPPVTPPPLASGAVSETQGTPPPAPKFNAAGVQLPSQAASAIAYVILFVPALVVWKAIGGIPGLFAASLIIFLFRGALAGVLQAIGGMFGGVKVGNLKADKPKADDLKELIPAAGAMFVVLLLLLWIWKPWSVKERFSYTKATSGKRCIVTIFDAKGEPVVEEMVVFIDDRARDSVKKDIPGKGRLQITFAGYDVTAVYFKGERIKEKGSEHHSYTSVITGTNTTLTIYDADGKVVRTVVAIGVAAPPAPASVSTRSVNQTKTNSIVTDTSAGRGILLETVKRPTITGHFEDVLLVEADFDRGVPTRVTYRGQSIELRR